MIRRYNLFIEREILGLYEVGPSKKVQALHPNKIPRSFFSSLGRRDCFGLCPQGSCEGVDMLFDLAILTFT